MDCRARKLDRTDAAHTAPLNRLVRGWRDEEPARVVVPLGAVALNAVMRYFTPAEAPVIVPVLAAPHPSPANGAHRAEQHLRMVNAFTRAAVIAGG